MCYGIVSGQMKVNEKTNEISRGNHQRHADGSRKYRAEREVVNPTLEKGIT